jgi:hypothetical protein
MADVMLRPPDPVRQEASTCWAAAAEAWASANNRLSFVGGGPMVRAAELVQKWRDAGFTDARGRLDPNLINPFALMIGMRMRLMRPGQLTLAQIAQWLSNDGYVYLIGRRVGHTVSHAVVVYGVQRGEVHFMDPLTGDYGHAAPGAWLHGMEIVGVGVPMFPPVRTNPFAGLNAPPTPYRPPADPLRPQGHAPYMGSPGRR